MVSVSRVVCKQVSGLCDLQKAKALHRTFVASGVLVATAVHMLAKTRLVPLQLLALPQHQYKALTGQPNSAAGKNKDMT